MSGPPATRLMRRWRSARPRNTECRGQERPGEEGGQAQDDGQQDGVLDHHREPPLRAASTALRRAVRAAPVFGLSWEARSALIPATRLSGTWARDPCRSVT